MARYVADEKCFVDNALHMPGDVFEFDGPEGSAFHLLGQPKKPKISDERMMDAAIRDHKSWDAEKVKLLSEIADLKNTVALRDITIKESKAWVADKVKLEAEISRLMQVIAQKNQVIKGLR